MIGTWINRGTGTTGRSSREHAWSQKYSVRDIHPSREYEQTEPLFHWPVSLRRSPLPSTSNIVFLDAIQKGGALARASACRNRAMVDLCRRRNQPTTLTSRVQREEVLFKIRNHRHHDVFLLRFGGVRHSCSQELRRFMETSQSIPDTDHRNTADSDLCVLRLANG